MATGGCCPEHIATFTQNLRRCLVLYHDSETAKQSTKHDSAETSLAVKAKAHVEPSLVSVLQTTDVCSAEEAESVTHDRVNPAAHRESQTAIKANELPFHANEFIAVSSIGFKEEIGASGASDNVTLQRKEAGAVLNIQERSHDSIGVTTIEDSHSSKQVGNLLQLTAAYSSGQSFSSKNEDVTENVSDSGAEQQTYACAQAILQDPLTSGVGQQTLLPETASECKSDDSFELSLLDTSAGIVAAGALALLECSAMTRRLATLEAETIRGTTKAETSSGGRPGSFMSSAVQAAAPSVACFPKYDHFSSTHDEQLIGFLGNGYCLLCETSVPQNESVVSHALRHAEELPGELSCGMRNSQLRCSICDASFCLMSVLRNHIVSVHGHQPDSRIGTRLNVQAFQHVTKAAGRDTLQVGALQPEIPPRSTSPDTLAEPRVKAEPISGLEPTSGTSYMRASIAVDHTFWLGESKLEGVFNSDQSAPTALQKHRDRFNSGTSPGNKSPDEQVSDTFDGSTSTSLPHAGAIVKCGRDRSVDTIDPNGREMTPMTSAVPQKEHRCFVCGKSFSVRVDLVAHALRHPTSHMVNSRNAGTGSNTQASNRFVCGVCGLRVDSFADHFKTHMTDIYAGSRSELPKNNNQDKSATENEEASSTSHRDSCSFRCFACCKYYSSKDKLVSHAVAHAQDLQSRISLNNVGKGMFQSICPVCGRRITTTKLLSHIYSKHAINSSANNRTDTTVSSRTCLSCGVTFKQMASLQKHALRHLDEKDAALVCAICGSVAFGHKTTLRKHIRRLHTVQALVQGAASKPLAGADVETGSVHDSAKTDLGQNKLSRTTPSDNSVLRYRCLFADCERLEFESMTVLAEHALRHAHEEQLTKFACFICRLTCASRNYLIKHIENVHGNEEKFACSACGDQFPFRSQLMEHKQRHIQDWKDCSLVRDTIIGDAGTLGRFGYQKRQKRKQDVQRQSDEQPTDGPIIGSDAASDSQEEILRLQRLDSEIGATHCPNQPQVDIDNTLGLMPATTVDLTWVPNFGPHETPDVLSTMDVGGPAAASRMISFANPFAPTQEPSSSDVYPDFPCPKVATQVSTMADLVQAPVPVECYTLSAMDLM